MCKGLATLPATCLKSAKDIKHKISFLLQKPDAQAADQKQTKERTAAAAAASAAQRGPPAAELEKWKESFGHMMGSQTGRTMFSSFLKSEFSEENMDFWVACEDYKRAAPSKQATRAKQIFQKYVEEDSPKEVNLDALTREETRQNLKKARPSCFGEAQKMIYTLMERDSYRRFLNSKLIQGLCQEPPAAAAAAAAAALACKEEKICDCSEARHAATWGA